MIWENEHIKIYIPQHTSDEIGRNKEEGKHKLPYAEIGASLQQ